MTEISVEPAESKKKKKPKYKTNNTKNGKKCANKYKLDYIPNLCKACMQITNHIEEGGILYCCKCTRK